MSCTRWPRTAIRRPKKPRPSPNMPDFDLQFRSNAATDETGYFSTEAYAGSRPPMARTTTPGLSVRTTMDTRLQALAQQTARRPDRLRPPPRLPWRWGRLISPIGRAVWRRGNGPDLLDLPAAIIDIDGSTAVLGEDGGTGRLPYDGYVWARPKSATMPWVRNPTGSRISSARATWCSSPPARR